jgi:hypothetical protein
MFKWYYSVWDLKICADKTSLSKEEPQKVKQYNPFPRANNRGDLEKIVAGGP